MTAPFHEDPEKANSRVQPPCEDAAGHLTLDAIEMVDWDGEADPANPRNWPARQRWGNVCLISMITIITYVRRRTIGTLQNPGVWASFLSSFSPFFLSFLSSLLLIPVPT